MIWPFGFLAEFFEVTRLDRNFPKPEPGDEHALRVKAVPADVAFDGLARLAVQIAAGEIGHGEDPALGPNRGEWVRQYCAPHGDGHQWCAAFAGWCYQAAADSLAIPLPFKRSLGAKRLGANVAAVGRKFTDATKARAGDLAIWHRGAAGSWLGHVALVESVGDAHTITTVEGNCPTTVRRRHHDLARERFAWFASLRREP